MIAQGEGLDEPRFSASGQWIAYRKSAKEIPVVRSDGKQGTTLGEWAESTHFRWLPREDRLAVPEEHDVTV